MNAPDAKFEEAVQAHYQALYRFALSLTRRESDACDLTQAAFERLLVKGDQLRDVSSVKTWLFTTLYHSFLGQRRRADRFPHVDAETAELPHVESTAGDNIDAGAVSAALAQVEEPYRAALVLFYLEDHSYREIAEILGVPIGTVMSRLSRGKTLLRALLADRPATNIVPLPMRAAS